MKKRFLYPFKKTVLMLLFVFVLTNVNANTNRDTLRVLFVGNSYIFFNNLPQVISLISDSMNTKLICKQSVLGGATLGDHWASRNGIRTRAILEEEKL